MLPLDRALLTPVSNFNAKLSPERYANFLNNTQPRNSPIIIIADILAILDGGFCHLWDRARLTVTSVSSLNAKLS